MKRSGMTLALTIALSLPCLVQTTRVPDANLQEQPTPAVKITQGPVVELVTDSTAQIAWSTNVNAGTVLHYGDNPQNLNRLASMPWGGLTHRVTLRDLLPETTYYFRAESPQGQDTGSSDSTPQSSFKTVAKGAPPVRNPNSDSKSANE